MHTFSSSETIFLHNGDFIGDVQISCRGRLAIVPFLDLVEFVGQWVRRERIAALEDADAPELLLGPTIDPRDALGFEDEDPRSMGWVDDKGRP